MKFTRILPKKIAIAWYEYRINRLRTEYEYYKARTIVFGQMLDETTLEFENLERGERK